MADKRSIEQVKSIINSDSSRRFVIVSAPGKRNKEDEKITDLLYRCYDEKVNTGSCSMTFSKIRERYIGIVEEMGLTVDINKYLDEVEVGIVNSKTSDYAASRGEYLCGVIMAEILGFEFVDSADIIKFNVKGQFDSEYSNDLVSKKLSISKGAVIPGFYGMTPEGEIKTFSRGGSDFTGAIIARGVMADLYENWTDVDGFMSADPRVVENPNIIDVLSYEELRELSYMGASVLHPESTFPLQNTNIPINIKNTFNPEAKGTLILKDTKALVKSNITGIAGRGGFTTIQIKKAMMNSELGFCRKVLSVLEYYGVSLEHMPSGIDTMSLVVSDSDIAGSVEYKVLEAIKGKVNPDMVHVYKNISLIAVVGHGMSFQKGTSAKIFSALAESNINVRMIDQGSSEINVIIGVNTEDQNKAIKAIYSAFAN